MSKFTMWQIIECSRLTLFDAPVVGHNYMVMTTLLRSYNLSMPDDLLAPKHFHMVTIACNDPQSNTIETFVAEYIA